MLLGLDPLEIDLKIENCKNYRSMAYIKMYLLMNLTTIIVMMQMLNLLLRQCMISSSVVKNQLWISWSKEVRKFNGGSIEQYPISIHILAKSLDMSKLSRPIRYNIINQEKYFNGLILPLVQQALIQLRMIRKRMLHSISLGKLAGQLATSAETTTILTLKKSSSVWELSFFVANKNSEMVNSTFILEKSEQDLDQTLCSGSMMSCFLNLVRA